jgi:hypothetical protein
MLPGREAETMFLKAMKDLLGDEVLASDGRLGALDDLYFDGECWQVRYLVIAAGTGLEEAQVLVSTRCVDAVQPRGRILVELSRMQLGAGSAAWPVEAASAWLHGSRACSGCDLLGFRIEAEDGAAGRVADLLVDDEEWCACAARAKSCATRRRRER